MFFFQKISADQAIALEAASIYAGTPSRVPREK